MEHRQRAGAAAERGPGPEGRGRGAVRAGRRRGRGAVVVGGRGGAGRGAVVNGGRGGYRGARGRRGRGGRGAMAGAAPGPDGVALALDAGVAGRGRRELVQMDLLRPNLNRFLGPQGRPFERKGIFMELDPKEFQEVIFKDKFVSKVEGVNCLNQALVKTYNDIQFFRLYAFWMRRNGASRDEIKTMKATYEGMLQDVVTSKAQIKNLKGEAVPMPPHFSDRTIIFGRK